MKRTYIKPPASKDFDTSYHVHTHQPAEGVDENEGGNHTRGNTMNLRNAALLIRDDLTTVQVQYLDENKTYAFLIKRDLAKQVKALLPKRSRLGVGDEANLPKLLVKSSRGIGLVRAVRVDDQPQVNLESSTRYRYAFALVDTHKVDQWEREDEVIYQKLQERKKITAREQILAGLGITDTQAFLADLSKSQTDDSE